VNSALKQQLIGTVSNIYIRTLHDCHTGFVNIIMHQLIEHLLRTYDNITSAILIKSDARFKTPYDTSEPIKAL
jgi:hypothetical protein